MIISEGGCLERRDEITPYLPSADSKMLKSMNCNYILEFKTCTNHVLVSLIPV